MAKRRKKRRGKRRERQQLPSPSRGSEPTRHRDKVLNAVSVGDVVSGTVVGFEDSIAFQLDGLLLLDVDGVVGRVTPMDLPLADGKSTRDRYAVGDTIHDLFVWAVDHDTHDLFLSLRRNAPSYVEALDAHKVRDVVSATVTAVAEGAIMLDVEGVIGLVGPEELSSTDREFTRDRYVVGDVVHNLFILQVARDSRLLYLSARRNTPDYVKAFDAHKPGDVVSAIVTGFSGSGELSLDIGGVIGSVPPWELSLPDGGAVQDHYDVGDIVDDLFVWQIDYDARALILSVRRNTPGYVEAFNAYEVGDVVSATITGQILDTGEFWWANVGGVYGIVPPWDMPLTDDGQFARDDYNSGDIVHDLFVWAVNHDTRDIFLSARLNAPGYVEALTAISPGDVLDGIVIDVDALGLWLHAARVVGWIPAPELDLGDGESPVERYIPRDSIEARVWQIDRRSRRVILSERRLDPDFPEEAVRRGATIDAVVQGGTPRGVRSPIRVLAANEEVWISPHALSLSTSIPSSFKDGAVIRVVVINRDEQRRPTELSHRRALEGWDAAVERLSPGVVVPDAYLLPRASLLAGEHRAVVDLGPISGFIPEEELDRDAAEQLREFSPNLTYPIVVESVDRERGTAIVSHEKFPERWRELAADLQEDAEVEAELREVVEGIAILDLGSGLLTNLPADQLPDVDMPSKAPIDRIGERIPLRISGIEHDKQIINVERREYWLEQLIGEPESETFELKEVLRGSGDLATRKKMALQVVRTINAFVNSKGGQLVIGVHDATREPLGLEGDSGLSGETIAKKLDNATQVLEDNIRFKPRSPLENVDDDLVTWRSASIGGKTLLLVECNRGPAHGVNFVRSEKVTEFWIRDGSNKQQLHTDDEINEHLVKRAQQISQENAASSNADAS